MSHATPEALADDELYSDRWTPEYRAWVKRMADRQWKALSKRYDALRKPPIQQEQSQ